MMFVQLVNVLDPLDQNIGNFAILFAARGFIGAVRAGAALASVVFRGGALGAACGGLASAVALTWGHAWTAEPQKSRRDVGRWMFNGCCPAAIVRERFLAACRT